MQHARITKHGLFQFVMALTAGKMSVALEDLGTTLVSLALKVCCHRKPAHWLGTFLQLKFAWNALGWGKIC